MQANFPVMIQQFPIMEPEHAEAMLTKYQGMARMIRQSTARVEEGVANGRVPIRYHVDKTVEQLDAYLALDPADDPYLALHAPQPSATATKRHGGTGSAP